MKEKRRRAASRASDGGSAEVDTEELFLLRQGEAVVDREVGEVEVAVAHARILPIDDPHPAPVPDEVRGKEVVVTRDRLVLGAADRGLDLGRPRQGAVVGGRGCRRRARGRSPRSPRRPGTSRTPTGSGRRRASRAAAPATSARALPSRSSSGSIPRPSMNSVTIAGGSVRHRRDGRRDADLRGRLVGGVLRAAVDAEQVRVLAGHPDHVVAAANTDPVVAVRDPALERLRIVPSGSPKQAALIARRSVPRSLPGG